MKISIRKRIKNVGSALVSAAKFEWTIVKNLVAIIFEVAYGVSNYLYGEPIGAGASLAFVGWAAAFGVITLECAKDLAIIIICAFTFANIVKVVRKHKTAKASKAA